LSFAKRCDRVLKIEGGVLTVLQPERDQEYLSY
jgi:hypothetical protein